MTNLEKVEVVREKTGVSYKDARTALEKCGYDVLDAIVLLEQQGKTQTQTAHHTTMPNAGTMSSEMARAQQEYQQSTRRTGVGNMLNRLMEALKRLCARGLDVSFVVDHNGSRVLAMPVLILAILVFFLLPISLPLLIVGLFFGFRYHFDGVGSLNVDVNDVMDKAADGAESLKRDVMGK